MATILDGGKATAAGVNRHQRLAGIHAKDERTRQEAMSLINGHR
jgi:hypothetical protein